jgi:hypothetical protein
MKAGQEIFEAHCRRYQRAGKKDKGQILDEVAGTTGLNRDHLAHAPASYGKRRETTSEGEGQGETAEVSPGFCGPVDAHPG